MTTYTMDLGESKTLAFDVQGVPDLTSFKVYIGSKSFDLVAKGGGIFWWQLTPNAAKHFGVHNKISARIESPIIGVQKIDALFYLDCTPSAMPVNSDATTDIVSVTTIVTVTETAITVESLVYDYAKGTNGLTYIPTQAWASDAIGTGWSLTPTALLKYSAWINWLSTNPNPPIASDFAGADWQKVVGDDGVNGLNGTGVPVGPIAEGSTNAAESGAVFIATHQKISSSTSFNNCIKELYITKGAGQIPDTDIITHTFWPDGGSELRINNVQIGVYVWPDITTIGTINVGQYGDYTIKFVLKSPVVQSISGTLDHNIVKNPALSAIINKQIYFDLDNDVTSTKNKVAILDSGVSNSQAYNNCVAEFYITKSTGQIPDTDIITHTFWPDGGSELRINNVQIDVLVWPDITTIGTINVGQYGEYTVAFLLKTPISAQITGTLYSDKILHYINTPHIGEDVVAQKLAPNGAVLFACCGDSITSNQVSNIGGAILAKLQCKFLSESISDGSPSDAGNITTEFGNLAVGYSTLTDIFDNSGNNLTTVRLLKSSNLNPNTVYYNVLSNQIRRLIQHTTPFGAQVSWTIASDNSTHNVDTVNGVGKGYIADIPKIIYIAAGVNDTANGQNQLPLTDDFNIVMSQTYSQLKRDSILSALRWVVETLQNVYPQAKIIIATPLYNSGFNSESVLIHKRDLIIKMCEALNISVVDSYKNSGINKFNADTVYGGLHPNVSGIEQVSSFVSGVIKAMNGKLY